MSRRASARIWAASLAGALLAGCTHTMPVKEAAPVVELPSTWSQAGKPAGQEWPDSHWWQRFGSEELSQLVRQGQDSNLELAAAMSRVRQAAAQARIAGVALLPAVDAYAGASRDLPLAGHRDASLASNAGFQVSYELDFWGRNAAGAAAAEASLRANLYDRQTVALTVTSGIVSTYLQLLSLHDRLAVARENARTAERVLKLVEAQSSVGAATPVDLARQRSAVASQRAAIPDLLQQAREAQAALAILLGQSPQRFKIGDRGLDTIRLPEVTAGMPSELLSRRPDIQRSEAMLAAASANVDAARAALFPSIRLTGSAGTQGGSLGSLLSPQNLLANVGASLVAPIFDGGRLRTERDLALEQKQELVQNYRSTVLAALAEVDTVLGQINSLDEQRRLKEAELEQARLAFNLSEIRYQAGAEDLMTVLDTQRSLSDVQNELGKLKLKRLQATVSLYKALGGGWQAS
ncbi:efflux transporter outer membrane subunit [Oxalobacteraceae bacterium A2-2]